MTESAGIIQVKRGAEVNPPDTISELIRLAVAAARKLDDRVYWPSWKDWHVAGHLTDDMERCFVCLGGAVIAGTLGGKPGESLCPINFSLAWDRAFTALDLIRQGNHNDAYRVFRSGLVSSMPDEEVPSWVHTIPAPLYSRFTEWDSFGAHLDSLERIAGQFAEHGC